METVPIWFVIMIYDPQTYPTMLWRVLKSIPCTLADVHTLYDQEFLPVLTKMNSQVQCMYVHRDMPNPFNTYGIAANEVEREVPIAALAEPSVWDI